MVVHSRNEEGKPDFLGSGMHIVYSFLRVLFTCSIRPVHINWLRNHSWCSQIMGTQSLQSKVATPGPTDNL